MLCYFVHEKVKQPPLLMLSKTHVVTRRGRHARTAVLFFLPVPVDNHSGCVCIYKTTSALQDSHLLMSSLYHVVILLDAFYLLQPILHQAKHAVSLC